MYETADANQSRRAITHAAVLALLCCLTIRSPPRGRRQAVAANPRGDQRPAFPARALGNSRGRPRHGRGDLRTQCRQAVRPASTTKLYSVAAALDALGKDYCFETPVYRRGTVDAEGSLGGRFDSGRLGRSDARRPHHAQERDRVHQRRSHLRESVRRSDAHRRRSARRTESSWQHRSPRPEFAACADRSSSTRGCSTRPTAPAAGPRN